ncbi:winged helix-turn-helix transcriptional regulator [Sneathiella sp.]|uniref:winged helix-turn-helix transcriptional regulator n=1 Tax=Sneathiella sp. TaxID=1964365 RepID=UPI0035635AE4
MTEKNNHNQCPMESILGQIMGPWTPYILWLLSNEDKLRFGEISARMPDISAKVLTDRLRKLESSGLINRDYQPTVPPTVNYSLTARGTELHGVLEGLNKVAIRWDEEDRQQLSAGKPVIAAE